ncbi:MAG: hypothetical protein JWN58_1507, partial [Gammaproteobacteria bacterium]|nr:hypothetical protein [Gammaproteobacteria bacterium]
ANVYTEIRAPDSRFLYLFCLAPLAAWKLRGRFAATPLAALLVFSAIGWVLWMTLFGNGRYLMPLALIAGPALVGCARAFVPRPAPWAWGVALLMIGVQTALLVEGSLFLWAGSPWQTHWIDARLPVEVSSAPTTFVSMEFASASWLCAFVHPGSRFIFQDALSIPPRSARLASKLSRLLADSPSITAIFVYSQQDAVTGKPSPESPVDMSVAASRVGLRVDFSGCRTGQLIESKPQIQYLVDNGATMTSRIGVAGFFFCPARYDPGAKREATVDPVIETALDNLERACPAQFRPGSAATLCTGSACWRRYSTTDLIVRVGPDRGVTVKRFTAYEQPFLGKVTDLARSAAGVDCHADLGRYVPWDPGGGLFAGPRAP